MATCFRLSLTTAQRTRILTGTLLFALFRGLVAFGLISFLVAAVLSVGAAPPLPSATDWADSAARRNSIRFKVLRAISLSFLRTKREYLALQVVELQTIIIA